ncbi:hypothetical protein M758_UG074000 [Ceratodon purpureus]|nr:hypothetical protein M758_UG074000 [Ceratodon purpureus]
MATLHSALRSLSGSLWCEASAPYGASGRKDGSLRPSRRSCCGLPCERSSPGLEWGDSGCGRIGVALDSNPSCLPLEEDSAFEGYDLKRVHTELGPHKRETLLKALQLVLSHGVPLSQSDIAAAIQAGLPIFQNWDLQQLFFQRM